MITPGPGVLSSARFAHGAGLVAHGQRVCWGLSDIDSMCPPASETHREAGCDCPTRCNIPLAGHPGQEEVTCALGHASDRIRLVDGPAGGEVFRHGSLDCCPHPAATSVLPRRTAGLPAARRFEPAQATSERAADRPSVLLNAPDSLAWLSRITTELMGALSAWASPLSEIFRQHMRQGKEMSQAIHDRTASSCCWSNTKGCPATRRSRKRCEMCFRLRRVHRGRGTAHVHHLRHWGSTQGVTPCRACTPADAAPGRVPRLAARSWRPGRDSGRSDWRVLGICASRRVLHEHAAVSPGSGIEPHEERPLPPPWG